MSLPVRRPPVRVLRVVLLSLVVIELLLAAGLYRTTQSTTGAGSVANPTAVPPVPTSVAGTQGPATDLPLVQNSPRTVVVGNKEQFSVQLPRLPNTFVTYTLTYPNEAPITRVMKTDATGYSKATFAITHQPAQFREPVIISVYYHNTLKASTRFAVQLPVKPGSH